MRRSTHRVVPAELAGERLDKVVAALFDVSRIRAKALIDDGAVFVGSTRARRSSDTVAAGQSLRADVNFVAPEMPDLAPRVLHADEFMVAIDKPEGIPSVPTASAARGTLLWGIGEQRLVPWRAEEVHRLDAATSGVILFAQMGRAKTRLAAAFRDGLVEKRYVARVHGVTPERGVIELPLEKDPTRAGAWRVAVVSPQTAPAAAAPAATANRAKAAKTRYQRLATGEVGGLPYSDLIIAPETGRTHQIRLHLTAIGFPILGDALYGNGERDRALKTTRLWLHAYALRVQHPLSRRWLTLTATIPATMPGFTAPASDAMAVTG